MRRVTTKLAVFTVFTILITFWLASIIGKLSPFDDTYELMLETGHYIPADAFAAVAALLAFVWRTSKRRRFAWA